MSGHSKWATIHRQKEVKDAKKGQVFTNLARTITIAARDGAGLVEAVEKARQYNMPKENINRAIERAKKGSGGEEVVFEGFLPGGVAVVIKVLTDNKLRTAQAVREALDKGGGSLGSRGSTIYLFAKDMMPNFEVKVSDVESRQKIETLLEKLGDLDDIQEVFTNYA